MADDDTQLDTGIPDFNGTDVSELTDDITEVVDDEAVADDDLLPPDEDEEKEDEEDPFADMATILDPNETNQWDDR